MKVRSDEKDSGVMFYYFMFFAKLAEKKNQKNPRSPMDFADVVLLPLQMLFCDLAFTVSQILQHFSM